ncbi:hypothetical protein AAE478_005775 [Parahypoxylon ruwenzoriense]
MTSKLDLQQKDSRGKDLVDEAVFNIFNGYLQPESTISAAQVAGAISKLTPEPAGADKTLGDGYFFGLWKSIIRVAEQIPHDHPGQHKLVSVMRELTLLPDTGITVWDTCRLWIDLPILGPAIREHLNGPGRSDVEEEQARLNKAWVRFHAFSARLIGAGVVDYQNQIIWMLREALEEENNPPKSSALDRDLMTAAMYIEYAGPIMVESLAANPEPELSDQLRRMLKGGSLFRDTTGLRLERWSFWRKRFREEAEKASTEEAKYIALRAARLMDVWSETRLKGKGEDD